jgi:hypothetical protein
VTSQIYGTQRNSNPTASAEGAPSPFLWGFALLTFLSSVMSLVSLIDYAIPEWQWSAVARLLFESWNRFLEELFTSIIPLKFVLEWLLSQIAHLLTLETIPTLYPHWKHVFVLLMAVFGSYAKAMFSDGRRVFGVYGLGVGIFFALLSALVSGAVPLDQEDFTANLIVAAGPAVLFFLAVYVIWLPIKDEPYESHTFAGFLARAGVTFVAITAATVIFMQIDSVRSNVHIGLLSLTGFAFVIAFHRIYCGFDSAKQNGEPIWSQPLTKRGLYILFAFVGATLFVVLDAGAQV